MSKELKKKAKKNPLLDSEDTAHAEEKHVEAADEVAKDTAEVVEPAAKSKKETEKSPAAPAKVDVAKALMSDAARTKATLEAEEMVHFMVPLRDGESKDSVHDVFINGFKWSVKKGKMVQIPKSVYEVLAQHYKVTSEAGSDFLIDGNKTKEDALV